MNYYKFDCKGERGFIRLTSERRLDAEGKEGAIGDIVVIGKKHGNLVLISGGTVGDDLIRFAAEAIEPSEFNAEWRKAIEMLSES